MNLSSLSNEDLHLLWNAVQDANNEHTSLIAGAVLVEQAKRKANERDLKTGYQIELLVNGKWKPIDETYLSIAVYSLFYASKVDAQKAVDRINIKIKNKFFEYQKNQIKKSEYRFVQVTTIREVV